MALRLIFAPGALGDWQQQLVKRQAPRHLMPRTPCLCGKSIHSQNAYAVWCSSETATFDCLILETCNLLMFHFSVQPSSALATCCYQWVSMLQQAVFLRKWLQNLHSSITIMAKNCRCTFLALIWKTVWLLFFPAWNKPARVRLPSCCRRVSCGVCSRLWPVVVIVRPAREVLDAVWLEHVIPKGLRSNAT